MPEISLTHDVKDDSVIASSSAVLALCVFLLLMLVLLGIDNLRLRKENLALRDSVESDRRERKDAEEQSLDRMLLARADPNDQFISKMPTARGEEAYRQKHCYDLKWLIANGYATSVTYRGRSNDFERAEAMLKAV